MPDYYLFRFGFGFNNAPLAECEENEYSPVQDVEFDRRVLDQGLGIGSRDCADQFRAVEVAGVEEVGRDALGFQFEAAEFEDPAFGGCFEEFGFVGREGCGRHIVEVEVKMD